MGILVAINILHVQLMLKMWLNSVIRRFSLNRKLSGRPHGLTLKLKVSHRFNHTLIMCNILTINILICLLISNNIRPNLVRFTSNVRILLWSNN